MQRQKWVFISAAENSRLHNYTWHDMTISSAVSICDLRGLIHWPFPFSTSTFSSFCIPCVMCHWCHPEGARNMFYKWLYDLEVTKRQDILKQGNENICAGNRRERGAKRQGRKTKTWRKYKKERSTGPWEFFRYTRSTSEYSWVYTSLLYKNSHPVPSI